MKTFTRNDECFKCPCIKCRMDPYSVGVDERLLIKINLMNSQMASEDMPGSCLPTSGRRCKEHNAAVGGAEHSQHLLGLAVDLATGGQSEVAYRIVDAAMVWNIPFIEVTKDHIHIDLRDIKVPKLIIGQG